MANILDYLDSFTHEQLCYELALIESISVGNLAKMMTKKAMSKVIGVTNQLLAMVSDNKLDNKGGDNIKDVIKQKQLVNMRYTKEELLGRYRLSLIEKLGFSSTQGLTDDKFGVAITDEAAELYKINDNYTTYQKLDMIYEAYSKEYIRVLYKILSAQNGEAIKITDEAIYQRIMQLPVDYRIRLKNTLCLADFSQKNLCKSIRSVGGRKILEQLVEFVGYDIFDTENVVCKIAYENVKDLSKTLMAYVVWRLIRLRGKGFYISDDVLPSYIISTQREKESNREKEYIETVTEHDNIRVELTRNHVEIETIRQDYMKKLAKLNALYERREGYRLNYEIAQNNYNDVTKRLDTARAELELYVDNVAKLDKTDPRYYKLSEEVNQWSKKQKSANKELSRISTSIREYFDEVKAQEEVTKNLKSRIDMLEKRIDKLENTFEVVNKKYDHAVDMEHYKLKTKWLTCFMELVFEESVLKGVVKDFNHQQILNVERALKELIDTTDIEACAKPELRKKDSNLNYMTFVPSEGTVGMIVYTSPADSNKKAFIAAISKNIADK